MDKQITITMGYDEWWSIFMEAHGHLNYWGDSNDSVEKLGDILDKYKEQLNA